MDVDIRTSIWRSDLETESVQKPTEPMWVYSLLSLYTGVVFFLSVPLNAMVVYASYKKPQVLRKPINYIIINLAVADLLCGAVTGVLILPSNMAGYYVWSRTVCVAESYMLALTGIVGLMSICIMAIERSVVICEPNGRQKITKPKALCGVIACWVWSVLWNLPQVIFGDGVEINSVGTACTPNWHSQNEWAGIYIPIYFVFCFAIPLLIIIFCYWRIVYFIRKLSKESTLSRRAKRERKVVKMVFVMILAFLISWTPYAVFSLYTIAYPEKEITGLYSSIPSYFAKSATIYNPLIYVGLNKQFRRTVKECCCCGDSGDFVVSSAVLSTSSDSKVLQSSQANLTKPNAV